MHQTEDLCGSGSRSTSGGEQSWKELARGQLQMTLPGLQHNAGVVCSFACNITTLQQQGAQSSMLHESFASPALLGCLFRSCHADSSSCADLPCPCLHRTCRWYAAQSGHAWGPEKPSLQETRTHAKCLRSVSSVRDYFREYRAKKKHVSTAAAVPNMLQHSKLPVGSAVLSLTNSFDPVG